MVLSGLPLLTAEDAFADPSGAPSFAANTAGGDTELFRSAVGLRDTLNELDIAAKPALLAGLLADLMEAFLDFRCCINDTATADKAQLDAVLVPLGRIATNIQRVIRSDELRADVSRYEKILAETAAAYNLLTAFLKRNAANLLNYARHARMLDGYRETLLDLSDRLFFTYDSEIGGIVDEFQATCLTAGNGGRV
jgi:hypothetical protein